MVSETTKTCTKCGETKPATLEFFSEDSRTKNGLKHQCKSCQAQQGLKDRKKANERQKKYRLNSRKKVAEQKKKYYLENREKIAEYNKKYKLENREKIAERRKEYRLENREKIAEYAKKYRLENYEKFSEYNKKYFSENSEKIAEYNKKYHLENPNISREKNRKRRALKLQNGHSPYTEDEVLDLYGTNCHLCNQPIDLESPRRTGAPGWEFGLQIDHVLPITKGGSDTLENVKPAHGKCNVKKSSKILS